jgi:hypothetical protein
VTTFDTTIHTKSGPVQVTVQDGSTKADLRLTVTDTTAVVYCDYRALHELAGLLSAAYGYLHNGAEVETEAGVDSISQPAGCVTVATAAWGAELTVDDRSGRSARGWLAERDCGHVSVALSAAANQM